MKPLSRLLLLAALAATVGCGERENAQATRDLPDIVLVSIDTLRADHLGSYGYFRDTSPAIDRLAAESILFERCLSTMATTLPAHMSLFTSTYPIEHGILANVKHGGRRFSKAAGVTSFAEVARSLGYETAAFVSSTPVKRDSGISTGFQTFDEPIGAKRPGDATMDHALAFLEEKRRAPTLIWIHLFDPHHPYDSPEPDRYATDDDLVDALRSRSVPDVCRAQDGREFAAADTINAYDAAIRFADRQVGRLRRRLEELDRWHEAVFVLVGDHGEGLCQHDLPFHGEVYDEQLHVPLVIRVPGQPPRRVASPLSVADVLPTLLALIGPDPWVDFLAQATGRNALSGGSTTPPVFSQRTQRVREDLEGPAFAITTDKWKFILEPEGTSRLYDLTSEGFELFDRTSEHEAVAAELRAITLERIAAQRINATRFRGAAKVDDAELSGKQIDELRSLGYLE